jgi:peptidyl-prolyl cis-trans isomerase SurA
MMRKQRWWLAALLALWCARATAAEIVDGVVAVVNDKIITYSEVRELMAPVLRQLERDYQGEELVGKIKTAQMDALNSLIDRALILQEFKDKGFNIPETAIDQELTEVIANEFGGDRPTFVKTLQAQNMTLSQYREKLRERIIVQAMRNRKAQQELVVSPYKMEKYYHDHPDEFTEGDQIKLRIIFIKKGPPAADAGAADPRRALAGEIVAKLDAGDSFDSLAKIYSEGKEAKQGGDWGWVGKDMLRKELNEVAFTLKTGQHSQPIDTAEGYYLLQVDAVKPAHARPLTEVRDEIEKILLQEQRARMQAVWVKQLRAKAYIRLY